jgi:hypothetical protein
MPLQYFALDSVHGHYGSVISALETVTAAKYGYVPTLVAREAAHDSAIRIVAANVAESELSGDLENLHRDNFPNALCRDRFIDLQDRRERGFAMLGEMVRSAFPAMTAVRYIAPAGAMSGANDGFTPWTAREGPAFTHLLGHVYYYLGPGLISRRGAYGTTSGAIPFTDGLGGDPIHVRMDHPLLPGCLTGAFDDAGAGTLPWQAVGGGVYVKGDWQHNGTSGQNFGDGLLVADGFDATRDVDALIDRHYLVRAGSVAAMAGGTFFESSPLGTPLEGWDAAKRDTGGAFTDVTAAANDAAAADFTFFVDAAADDDAFYFIDADIFSRIHINISASGSGDTYTYAWEYWNGSAWASIPDFVDDFSGLKAGSGNLNNSFNFNPPNDWAATTVDGSTGYAVRIRKAGGAVAGAVLGTQTQLMRGMLYVRKWDDSAPVKVFRRRDGLGGYFFDVEGQSNYKLVNCQIFDCGLNVGSIMGCLRFTLAGGRYMVTGDWKADNNELIELIASTDGRILYNTSNRTVRDASHPYIADHLIARHGSDPARWADMDRWVEINHCRNGPFKNNTALGTLTISGLQIIRTGEEVVTAAGGTGIDFGDVSGGISQHDGHTLAARGNCDATTWTLERFILERVGQAIVWYSSGEGDVDAPYLNSASVMKNIVMRDFIIHEWNGRTDNPDQPCGGILYGGDNDHVLMNNGTGVATGNLAERFVVANLSPPDSFLAINGVCPVGAAVIVNSLDEVTYQDFSVIGCNWVWTNSQTGRELSWSAVIVEDNGSGFTDVTANVIASGDTTTDMFPASEAVNDAIYFGYIGQFIRRCRLTIETLAAGTYVLAFEYWNGSSWAAVSNLSDGTAGLTADGTITFDRPGDAAETTVNGQGPYYYWRIRLASGSFTTNPTFSEARSATTGARGVLDRFQFENMRLGINWTRANNAHSNWGYVRADNFTGTLKSGETISGTNLFKYFGSTAPIPDGTLSAWQAHTKSAVTTDAPKPSLFAPSVSTSPGVHIAEIP